MLSRMKMSSVQQKQKRGFLDNNHNLMSVSLQFERGLWNIPFGGFKLPTSELRNTKIKYATTPKQLAQG